METRDAPARTPILDVSFQRPDGLALGVEIVGLGGLLRRRLPVDLSAPQRIRFHQVILVRAGHTSHQVDFGAHEIGPGALVVVAAGQVQAFAPTEGLEGVLAVFTPAYLEERSGGTALLAEAARQVLAAGPVVRLDAGSRRRAARAFSSLAHASAFPPTRFADPAVGAAFAAFLFQLAGLREVADAAARREPADPLVARFVALVEQRFREPRAVAAYARELHVTVRTLDRRVSAARSVTAAGLIAARRMLEARRLLTLAELPIKAVADALGFSEPHNFTRFFRGAAGVSPSDFRRGLLRRPTDVGG